MSNNKTVILDGRFQPYTNSNPLPSSDYFLEVVKGNVPGTSFLHKFGENDSLNTSSYEDIWDAGGVYSFPADGTAPITKLVSTSASDTEPIFIQGLDIDGVLTSQTITLTGTTPVSLTTPLWRVFRAYNDDGADLVGTVTITDTAGTTVYAQINIGNNQTLMCIYTIPAGKTGYLLQGTANMADTKTSVIAGRYETRNFGSIFKVQSTFALNSSGTNSHNFPFPVALPIAEKTDLRVRAISSSNGVAVSCTFDLLLVDN